MGLKIRQKLFQLVSNFAIDAPGTEGSGAWQG